jgi:hypothetical protein
VDENWFATGTNQCCKGAGYVVEILCG